MRGCKSTINNKYVIHVTVVYMRVVPEPNTMSDRIKAFRDDPQWSEHIGDP